MHRMRPAPHSLVWPWWRAGPVVTEGGLAPDRCLSVAGSMRAPCWYAPPPDPSYVHVFSRVDAFGGGWGCWM